MKKPWKNEDLARWPNPVPLFVAEKPAFLTRERFSDGPVCGPSPLFSGFFIYLSVGDI
jgi:hypothetical protein